LRIPSAPGKTGQPTEPLLSPCLTSSEAPVKTGDNSEVKTLAELVAAALRMPRASLAELGRRLAASTCKTAKHCIKRAWRFTSNERIHIPEAMQGPLRWLFRQRRCWKKHPLVVSMDWTKVRSFHTLMLATVVRGRALPLLWESYQEGKLPKSQNYLEERLLRVLRSLVPSWVEVIVVADRGFGRTELARTCQELGFHYVLRIQPKVYIEHRQYRGRLERFPVARGSSLLLTDVRFRKSEPVKHHVAICWPKGLPQHRDECWYLMTDLAYSVHKLTKLYARRMTLEELFRDAKNRRPTAGA
jgi:hypothetical protein